MKTHHQIMLWLALLALLAFSSQRFTACAGEATLRVSDARPGTATLTPGGTNKTQAIPWDQIGAKAGADYHGDGLAVVPTPEGARLRCLFQRLEGEATTDGLWLVSTVTNRPGNRFRVVATAVGRQALAPQGTVTVDGQTVRFRRAGLVEEYSVSMDGVRQDFVIAAPPAGTGELRVELALSGARAETTAGDVRLKLTGSERELAYSRLRVEDAAGRELTARLEVLSSHRLAVSVADADADYPVRIDPTFSDADWVPLGSGLSGDVQALLVSGSNLYAGGPGVWNWDGLAWTDLGSPNGGWALAVVGTNLYAGGWPDFDVSSNAIVKWDGNTWLALGSGLTAFGDSGTTPAFVNALAVSGTNLYVGGYFAMAGGVPANSIAKWDGSAWSALGSGLGNYGTDPTVRALATIGTNLNAFRKFMVAGW